MISSMLCESVVHFFLLLSIAGLSLLNSMSSYYSWDITPCQIHAKQKFPPSLWLTFSSEEQCILKTRAFKFVEV